MRLAKRKASPTVIPINFTSRLDSVADLITGPPGKLMLFLFAHYALEACVHEEQRPQKAP
jgi:hypothetical protein